MSVENVDGHHPLAKQMKWSIASRVFHWGSVVLLLLTWIMILLDGNADSNTYILLHKALGVSVLFWMIARVINRVFTSSPEPLSMPMWQKAMSHLTHFALYALLIAMPLAGILMSMYGGRGISMFGLFDIPVLVEPNRNYARFFNNLHTDIIWPLLLVFTALHIGGALFHQFIQKDNLIARMR